MATDHMEHRALPLMDELLTLARDIAHMSIGFDDTSIRDSQRRMAEIFAEIDEMGDLAP